MLAIPGAAGLAAPAVAGGPGAAYCAYIGAADRRSSRGLPLRRVAAILRQDRANVHRYGVTQAGDTVDTRFADYRARDEMEKLLEAGRIEPTVRRAIRRGDVTVVVEILVSDDVLRALRVDIAPSDRLDRCGEIQ